MLPISARRKRELSPQQKVILYPFQAGRSEGCARQFEVHQEPASDSSCAQENISFDAGVIRIKKKSYAYVKLEKRIPVERSKKFGVETYEKHAQLIPLICDDILNALTNSLCGQPLDTSACYSFSMSELPITRTSEVQDRFMGMFIVYCFSHCCFTVFVLCFSILLF